MKLRRRQFLHLAAGAAALSTAPRVAWAQSYPAKPVRWIVGFAPAGGNDIVARLMGQWLTERLGQSFVIENRPGAGHQPRRRGRRQRGARRLHAVSSSMCRTRSTRRSTTKLNFNFIRDITPVAAIMRMPNVMLVNPSVPVKTVPEFIAYAKANPGKINMASAGIGSGGPSRRRAVQDDDGREPWSTCRYRGNGPALTDLTRRTSGGSVRHACLVSGVHQNRQAAGTWDHYRETLGGAAGSSGDRRLRLKAMRRARGTESPHRRARPPMSSKSSTRRSTRPWSTRI